MIVPIREDRDRFLRSAFEGLPDLGVGVLSLFPLRVAVGDDLSRRIVQGDGGELGVLLHRICQIGGEGRLKGGGVIPHGIQDIGNPLDKRPGQHLRPGLHPFEIFAIKKGDAHPCAPPEDQEEEAGDPDRDLDLQALLHLLSAPLTLQTSSLDTLGSARPSSPL